MNNLRKKNNIILMPTSVLMVLQVLILRWAGLTALVNCLINLLVILCFCKSYKKIVKRPILFVFVLISMYFAFNYMVMRGHQIIVIKNYYQFLSPFMVMLFFAYIMIYEPLFLKNYIYKIKRLTNAFMFLNIPIIILEWQGFTRLASLRSFSNSLHVDLISGLFGANGTPMLAVFSAFAVVLNIHSSKYYRRVNQRRKSAIISFVFIVIYSFVSFINDNKGFFIVLASFLLCYYIIGIDISSKSVFAFLKRVWKYIVLFLLIISLAYRFTPLYKYINAIIHEIQIGYYKSNLVQGSNERIGMISYIVQQPEFRNFGYGFGYSSWTNPMTFGFIHYGQSDVGTFMCLGGIAFIALLFLCIYILFKKIFINPVSTICVLIVFAVLGIYSQVFTVTSLMISTMLFFSVSLIVKVVVSKTLKYFIDICSSCLSGFTMVRISCK